MPDSRDGVRLADSIAHDLSALNEHLITAPAADAVRIISALLDADDGILGRVATLMATGSHRVRPHAERGTLPAEVWLALGRASNELHDTTLDLDPHAEALRTAANRTPATGSPSQRPSEPSPLIVRRHR
ncbi:hypothetical protein [Streptomyces sp. RFCAC02]|uniref:hypothetical protein n=1 Tax=Streptomyces sp. RFCAC02 TaxID=2499143 RepID=UPI0010208EC9|nr:hypothetical protein [Streptomyces sp. RFCAC02]